MKKIITIADLSAFYLNEIVPQLGLSARGVKDKKYYILQINSRIGSMLISKVRTREIQLYVWDRQKSNATGAVPTPSIHSSETAVIHSPRLKGKSSAKSILDNRVRSDANTPRCQSGKYYQ